MYSTTTTTPTTNSYNNNNKRNRNNENNENENENKSINFSIPTLSVSEFKFVQQYFENENLKKQKIQIIKPTLIKTTTAIRTRPSNPILPLYIQKKILNCLIQYINRVCQINNPVKYIQEQHLVNKLLGTLSLICWSWFKHLSLMLNVITDFNITLNETNFINLNLKSQLPQLTQTKFNLFKYENINFIKFYKICNQLRVEEGAQEGQEELQEEEEEDNIFFKLNKLIEKFENLDRILITFVRDNKQLEGIKRLQFPSIEIGNLELRGTSELSNNIVEVKRITIKAFTDHEKLGKHLNRFKPMEIILSAGATIPFKELVLSKSNCFSNLKVFEMDASSNCEFGIEDLNFLLKSSTCTLKVLSIKMCLHNLFYNITNQDEKYKCRNCNLNSNNSFLSSNDEQKRNEYNNYQFHWHSIINLITNHKHLYHISIENHCSVLVQNWQHNLDELKSREPPNEFIATIDYIISKNNYLNFINISGIKITDYLNLDLTTFVRSY